MQIIQLRAPAVEALDEEPFYLAYEGGKPIPPAKIEALPGPASGEPITPSGIEELPGPAAREPITPPKIEKLADRWRSGEVERR